MYLIEIIAKFLQNRKNGKNPEKEVILKEDYEPCEHFYVAIDSSKDYFACSKCGNVIKNNQKAKKINIFKI